jgi:hypothetical protein
MPRRGPTTTAAAAAGARRGQRHGAPDTIRVVHHQLALAGGSKRTTTHATFEWTRKPISGTLGQGYSYSGRSGHHDTSQRIRVLRVRAVALTNCPASMRNPCSDEPPAPPPPRAPPAAPSGVAEVTDASGPAPAQRRTVGSKHRPCSTHGENVLHPLHDSDSSAGAMSRRAYPLPRRRGVRRACLFVLMACASARTRVS